MAIGNFDQCFSETLKWEKGPGSGWSENRKDPGGDTMCGITLSTYSRWIKRRASPSELRNLNLETIKAIYNDYFWKPISGDSLPKGVDMMLYDISVNSGDGREHPWAIETEHLLPVYRIKKLDQLRRGFWRHLPTFTVFGKGWFRRENEILSVSLKMAQEK